MILRAISLTYAMLMRIMQGVLTRLRARWQGDVASLTDDNWRDVLRHPNVNIPSLVK